MSTLPCRGRRGRPRLAERHTTVIVIVIAIGLVLAGVAYAEVALDDPADHGPVIGSTAGFTPVPEYPGWSYAAATSEAGEPGFVLRTTLGEGRTCANPGGDAGMLGAGFITDESTGSRYGYITGFTQPGEEVRAAFSDGTTRTVTSTAEGAYIVAVMPADIEGGVLPARVSDASGAALVVSLPREVFEAGG